MDMVSGTGIDALGCDYDTPSGPASEEGMRLFGVRLTHQYKDHFGLMRKSMSMGNLAFTSSSLARMCIPAHVGSVVQQLHLAQGAVLGHSKYRVAGACCEQQHGYISDGPVTQTSSLMKLRERKKGVPWTEDEHRLFLAGLQKLGKGDWRGISRNFVASRTPTQVASHAQKYFLRQGNLGKRKRRSSLFDIMSSNNAAITYSQHIMAKLDFNMPTPEHGLTHARDPISPFIDMLPLHCKPLPSSPTSCLSAELSLGCPAMQQCHVLSDHSPSYLAGPGKHNDTTSSASFSGQLPSFQHVLERDASTGIKPAESSCLSSSSSKSLSPSSSFQRIDEASELSRLSLSIGPPSMDSCDQLALKLEHPAM